MPRSFGLRLGVAVCLAAMLLLAACGDGESKPAPTLSSVTVSPATASVVAGKTQQFKATAKYSDGSTKDVTSVTWSSSNTTIATITGDGLLTGKAAGTVTIGAATQGVSGSAQATVSAAELTAIKITPAALSVPLGRAPQLVAKGTFTDNSEKPVTATWTSSNEAVATVSSTGLLTTVSAGTSTITATSGTFTSTAALTVSNPVLDAIEVSPSAWRGKLGEATQMTATAVRSDGLRTDVTATATWSTPTGSVVSVLDTEGRKGLTLASGIGTDTLTATFENVSGTSAVEVWAPKARFAYAPNENANAISIYSVSPEDGTLRSLGFQQTPASTWWTSVDATGSYLLSAEDGNPNIGEPDGGMRVYRINADTGALTEQSFAPGGDAWQLAVHPNTRFVFMANANNLNGYILDENGIVSSNGVYLQDENLRSLALDPTGKYLYVGSSQGKLHIFSVDQAAGTLTELESSPVAFPEAFRYVAVDRFGRFLYATTLSSLIGFTIDASTGELTPMEAPFTCPDVCVNFAMSPDGSKAYLTTRSTTEPLVTFSIDPATGALTQEAVLSDTAVEAYGVTLSPDANYLYFLDDISNVIKGVAIDPASRLPGAFVATARAISSPSSLAFATGEQPILYRPTWAAMTTTDGTENATNYLFAVDPVTGGLSLRNSSSFTVNPAAMQRTRTSLETMRAAKPAQSKLFGTRRAAKPAAKTTSTKKAVK